MRKNFKEFGALATPLGALSITVLKLIEYLKYQQEVNLSISENDVYTQLLILSNIK